MWKTLLISVVYSSLLFHSQRVESGKPKAARPANMALLMEETVKRFGPAQNMQGRASGRPGRPSNTWECEKITGVPANIRRDMKLSSFYKKYLHAYGIPILSSHRVKDSALRRACYVVTFVMADRQDLRNYFYSRNGRAAVIAHKVEQVTTIPEHSWLPSWWNQRARGLGGTIQHPISTCGEENLLCYKSDPWRDEDIFLHEFVHAMHNVAIASNGAIPDFDRRISSRYNYLKRTGERWANTYAMSTDREYLAEGAQSYFDVDADINPPNGIHNHINTREELRGYDPVLFGFCREIFPCGNKIVDRCDEVSQQSIPAKRWHFRMNCNKDGSGGIWMDFKTKQPVGVKPTQQPGTPPAPQTPPPSTNRPTPPAPQTPPPPTNPPTKAPTQSPGKCVDNHNRCSYWASIGECNKNPRYMKVNCKKSCRVCNGGGGGGGCVDKDNSGSCRGWAQHGYCRSNRYVYQNCKKSCGLCSR